MPERAPRRRAAIALALLSLLGSACGSDGDSSTPSASSIPASSIPASTPTSNGSATETTVAGKARVVLEDAGARPRQVLVLHVAAGQSSKVALVSRLGLEMTVDGNELPSTVVPGTRTVLDQRVERVDPDGTIHFSATFGEVSVVDTPGADPDVVSQTEDALSELDGLHGTGTVGADGGGQTIVFDTGTLTDSNLKSTIDSVASQVGNLSAPFPTEPVGTGARWTVTSSATINGITMNTTTHYTLRSRAGDRYEIDLTQEAAAPPGPAAFPGLPAGTKASIASFAMQSTGSLTGDLTRQLPLKSTVTGSGDGELTITAGADEANLVEHLTIDFSMTPA